MGDNSDEAVQKASILAKTVEAITRFVKFVVIKIYEFLKWLVNKIISVFPQIMSFIEKLVGSAFGDWAALLLVILIIIGLVSIFKPRKKNKNNKNNNNSFKENAHRYQEENKDSLEFMDSTRGKQPPPSFMDKVWAMFGVKPKLHGNGDVIEDRNSVREGRCDSINEWEVDNNSCVKLEMPDPLSWKIHSEEDGVATMNGTIKMDILGENDNRTTLKVPFKYNAGKAIASYQHAYNPNYNNQVVGKSLIAREDHNSIKFMTQPSKMFDWTPKTNKYVL